MESYVDRWSREQKAKAQKPQKEQKGQKALADVKEVQKDGTDTRSEGHEAQAEADRQSAADTE